MVDSRRKRSPEQALKTHCNSKGVQLMVRELAFRGKLVAVSFVTDKGEKLAKSIDVLEARR